VTHYVYILRCSDDTYYTGSTMYLRRRLKEHLSGHGAKYVKGRLPVELVYTELYPTLSEARRREARIKTMCHDEKTNLIEKGERYRMR